MAAAPLRHTWSDPDSYETFMGRWSEFLVPKFIAFTGVSAGGRVLDVGSGTGVLSKALADRGCHVIGIDATGNYLEQRAGIGHIPISPLKAVTCAE